MKLRCKWFGHWYQFPWPLLSQPGWNGQRVWTETCKRCGIKQDWTTGGPYALLGPGYHRIGAEYYEQR
jgi:hypothetical protein